MNPLSPLTYYRRHKRRAMLLLSLISLVTAGIYLMAALSWAVFVEPGRSNYMFLSKFSVVVPEFYENGPDPAVIAQVIAQIRANPDVAHRTGDAFHNRGRLGFQCSSIPDRTTVPAIRRVQAVGIEARLLQPHALVVHPTHPRRGARCHRGHDCPDAVET